MSKKYQSDGEINSALSDIGVPRNFLINVMRRMHDSYLQAGRNHPPGAAGSYAYFEGVAALRQEFSVLDGWQNDGSNSVEGVYNPDKKIKIGLHGVELACCEGTPQPQNKKGSGSQRETEHNAHQMEFPFNLKEARNGKYVAKNRTYFIMYSITRNDVLAELSCPVVGKNGKYEYVIERIMFLSKGMWSSVPTSVVEEEDNQEYPVDIKPKSTDTCSTEIDSSLPEKGEAKQRKGLRN